MRKAGQSAMGVQPFWFWNGRITADEVARQIRAMKAQGVRGFFLHPRQGMDLPYMSARFLEMVGVAVDTARLERMEMWLYDEYPYPSGVAGGELLLTPEFTARELRHDIFDAQGPVRRDIPWGKVLYARAFPLEGERVCWREGIDLRENIGIVYAHEILQNTGLSAYNRKRFFTGGHGKRLWWDAPSGRFRVFIFCECELDDFKYFGGLADPVNPAAMREYIRLTHQRYYDAFPEAFGPVIRGIFTDETAPIGHHPMWSPLMPALYARRCGGDLIERLPALLVRTDGDDERFLYAYNDTLYRAFVESYDMPIRAWCEAHGILYTGEKVHMRAEQLRHMHIPGMDGGHVKAGARAPLHADAHRANPKSVASYAHFTGDGTALCEAYHSVGWDMTMRDMRWMADWLGIQGINLIVPHAYYYTDDALRKYDAPPSAFESMPWYAKSRLYAAHVDRVGDLTRRGKRVARLLIVDRAGAIMAQKPLGFPRPREGSMLHQLEYALSARHIDYYIIDRDLLSEVTARADGGILLRGEAFQALLLPDLPVAEQALLDAALRVTRAGGQVIAVGAMPSRNISTGEALNQAALGFRHAPSPEACMGMLCDAAAISPRIERDGQTCAQILAAQFDMDGRRWLYSVNLSRERIPCALSLPGAGDAPIALVDTVTGEAERMDGSAAAFWHTYEPFACALFCTGEARPPAPPGRRVEVDPWAEYPCRPQAANLLRMAVWDADLGGNRVRVDSMPVINQLLDTKSKIEAVEQSDFGCRKRLQFPAMALGYAFRFESAYDGPVHLVMEPGSIRGAHEILLNGHRVPAAMETRFVFKRTNLVCDVTPWLQRGANELVVRVNAALDHDGVVNPLYLAGDFAVLQEGDAWKLLPPVGKASPMAPEKAGYPFFSGVMDYDISGLLAGLAGDTAEIAISDWRFEHCAELLINGISLGTAAWNPYRFTARIPSGALVTLRVFGTLLAAYEGARFDQDAHATVFLQAP